jgi:hypothetical protein
MLDFNIRGTVLSGVANRTTLGNTLRVLSYIDYIAHKAGVPENCYRRLVSGDDALILMHPQWIPKFTKWFWKCYTSTPGFIEHGLGLICREDEYLVTDNVSNFLSLNIIYNNTEVIVHRDIARAYKMSHVTKKVSVAEG